MTSSGAGNDLCARACPRLGCRARNLPELARTFGRLTYSIGGRRSVVKQAAVRTGNVLLIVSGSPGLVDANLEKVPAKAAAAH